MKTKTKISAGIAAVAICLQFTFATAAHSQQATLTGVEMINHDKANMAWAINKNLRNVSWCEIILWDGNGATFNSMGEGDPKDSAPYDLFKKLDKNKLAKKYQVTAVSLNPDTGRKFWTCDEFDINASKTVRDFEGIKARYVGEGKALPNGKPQSLTAAAIPRIMYKTESFFRVSKLIFKQGKPVFLLIAPNGNVWINKAYQTGVDPTLTYVGMSTLDKHLKHLPQGWKFKTLILPNDLVIKANGVQPIMWDELGDAYDLLVQGTYNLPLQTFIH